MEPSIWKKFFEFIKHSLTEKFKAFFPGCVMGFIGGQHLLWDGIPPFLVTDVWKILIIMGKAVGTLGMAFGSGLATSYASKLVDRHFEKKTSTAIVGLNNHATNK